MKIFLMFLPLLLLTLCGCIREEVGGEKLAFARRAEKKYEPLRNYRLKLELLGSGLLYAGEGGYVTFALTNIGNKPVNIEEWYANEVDNIIISCQNWLPGMTTYDPNNWIRFDVVTKKPEWRYPLSLAPGNKIFVKKQVPFIDSLTISRGSERRFFIKAELNLRSVRLESPVKTLSVRNIADKRQKPVQREKSRHFGR